MSTENALVEIPAETALQVYTEAGKMEPFLKKIEDHVAGFTGDVSTKKGREEIASMAHKVAKSKVYLEKVGKGLADEAKSIPKKIDATRRLVEDRLDALRDKVRAPLTAWEEAEAERVAKIKRNLGELEGTINDREERTAEVLRDRLAEVKAEAITEEAYGEYTDAALELRTRAIEVLEERAKAAEQREKDAAELAELRRQQADRAAQEDAQRRAKEMEEREARIAKEAAEKAVRDAEQAAAKAKADAEAREQALKDQAAKAERDAAEAEARRVREQQEAADRIAKAEKDAADKAAADLARQQREEQEAAAARERNRKHRGAINKAALEAFVTGGLDEAAAKLAIELIAKKMIPAIHIQY